MLRNTLKRIVVIWILLIGVVAFLGEFTWAETNAGRTSADFLLIGHGARAAGFSGAYTAVSDGPSAAYWNPAGLAGLESGRVSLGHFSWFQDITVEQMNFGMPISDAMVAALSLTYVNYGTIDGYDQSGIATGQIAAYDWAGGLSLSYALSDQASIGITGKFVNQRLDDLSASSFAADFGLRYSFEAVVLAATVNNLGGEMQFDQVAEKLPASARLGVQLAPFSDALVASFELEKRFQGDLHFRQGMELGFSDRYYLRAGLDYNPAQSGRRMATGMSFGAGVQFDFGGFDYAYTPNDKTTSEDLHRFTLTFLFSRE
jgi:hypothetical protein